MLNFIKKQSPARIMAMGFLLLIAIGSILLFLPISLKDGVSISYIDSLYISTSAICVTGLTVVDVANTFSLFGQIIILVLIQIGGLGVTSIGAMLILAVRKKMDLKGIKIMRESLNLDSARGITNFILDIFLTTLFFEAIGTVITFLIFLKDFTPTKALWVAFFHSVSAFNNAGFDILGNYTSLIPYVNNVIINLTTSLLIIFGGLGFLVIKEILATRFKWKKFSMHTKVVLTMTASLIIIGTIFIKLTENVTLMGAFFLSVSARTAGFTTYPLEQFTRTGLILISALTFIGASPGSTGGGIKTTTFFVLFAGLRASATNTTEKAFHYSIPQDAFKKAASISLLSILIILTGTYLFCIFEPGISLIDVIFEVISAFGTSGLSTGITPFITTPTKILCICLMYVGRLGPLTIASLWSFSKGESFSYPVGNISIG